MVVPLLPEVVGLDQAQRCHPHITGWRSLPCAIVQVVGGGPYRLRLRNRSDIVLAAGEGWFLPAGTEHCIDAPRPGTVVPTAWAHLRCPVGAGDLLDRIPLQAPIGRAAARPLAAALKELLSITGGDVLARARHAAAAARLLVALLGIAPPGPASEVPPGVAAAQAAVEADPAAPWSRAAMAHRAGLSGSRFHVVFRQTVGCSPVVWLRRLRLRRAQELLLGSPLPVFAVAARVGYPDPFHFSRAFTAACGSPPRTWRRLARVGG